MWWQKLVLCLLDLCSSRLHKSHCRNIARYTKLQIRKPDPMCTQQGQAAAAATVAKSLQSCPALCDPIDGSPPGSPVHGVFQARVLGCRCLLRDISGSEPIHRTMGKHWDYRGQCDGAVSRNRPQRFVGLGCSQLGHIGPSEPCWGLWASFCAAGSWH